MGEIRLFDGEEKPLTFEKGDNYSVFITDKINNFLIAYQPIEFNNIPLNRKNLTMLLERINRVACELKVSPSQFIIELHSSTDGSCCVDINKNAHVRLPVTIKINGQIRVADRGIHQDYLLYHELMHAKEVLDGRDHSSGIIKFPQDLERYLIGFLFDFANDGYLEAIGKPHKSKKQWITNMMKCIEQEIILGNITNEKIWALTTKEINTLCEQVWGKIITFNDAQKLIRAILH